MEVKPSSRSKNKNPVSGVATIAARREENIVENHATRSVENQALSISLFT